MIDIQELKRLQHDYYVIGHEPQEDAYKQALIDCADELIVLYEKDSRL